MSSLSTVAKKFKRALRNETGTSFSLHELRTLAEAGALDSLQRAETEELKATWAAKHHPTSSATSGSTSGATVNRPKSGKSPVTTPTLDRSAIAALGAGA